MFGRRMTEQESSTFEAGRKVLDRSGVIKVLEERGGYYGKAVVSPCTRKGEVNGAAAMVYSVGGNGSDYLEGNGIVALAEMDERRLTIRSMNFPVEIKLPKRGDGGWVVRRPIMENGIEAAKINPATIFWCEGIEVEIRYR